MVVTATAAGLLVVVPPVVLFGDPQRRFLTFAAAWVLAIVVLAAMVPARWYGASVLYLGVFGAFHGGLLLATATDSVASSAIPSGWHVSPFMSDATRLATIGMLAFALAVACTARIGRGATDRPRPARADAPGDHRRLVGRAGLIVQGVGLLLFAVVIHGAGWVSSFTDGYLEFLSNAPKATFLSYGSAFIGIGSVLAIVSGGRHRTAGWLAFCFYAVFAFPLGLRGEVLFPLTVLFVLEVRRGFRLRLITAGLAAASVLALISAVRQTRLSGVPALFAGKWELSPLDAITEMGNSLRPCVEVVSWHAAGEPLRHGVTFIAAPMRMVERILAAPNGRPAYDTRLFEHEIATRVGNIGGSPIAEGYHNFGLVGVVGVMVVLGLVVGALERRNSTLFSDAVLGIVLLPIFVEVRNSSTPVIPNIVLGLTILWIVRLCAVKGGVHSRDA